MTTPVHLSADQIDAFKALIEGNARPVQPLNDRVVASDLVSAAESR
jgi:carbonic anhydrase